MTDAHPRGDGLDPMFAGFSHAFVGSTEQAVQAWTRGVSIYAAYLEALSATKRPEDLLAAQQRFVEATLEAFGPSAVPLQSANGLEA